MFAVFSAGCLALLVLGIVEQRRHYANLRRIPTRVLINGIRGKSSITRLCAGALRGGGLVTVAKTTGTAARFIHPDGSEEPVYRKFGIANVVEQIGIVRRAAAYQPDVLAIECMAVMPDLQEINQGKLIKSTIGVLCNVREDHLAEMGPTLDDVARSLSRSMPVGGVCVTAEKERLHILKEEAERRDCELIAVDPESVTDEQMAGFSWITFKENVAIAFAVADLLGVNRQSALAGMWAAAPDPGVLSVKRYQVDGLRLRFANVFAANDPESTLMNIEQLLGNKAIERPLHVVINCRPDRIERNGQMGALIGKLAPVRVVLIGEATRSAKTTIPADWTGDVVDLGGRRESAKLLAGVLDGMKGTASLVTIGNIHGQGEVLLDQLADLPPEPTEPAEQAGSAEPGKPTGQGRRPGRGRFAKPDSPAEPAGSAGRGRSAERVGFAQSAGPAEWAGPGERTGFVEPVGSRGPGRSVEPVGSAERRRPAGPARPAVRDRSADPAGPVEPARAAESVRPAEPARSAGFARPARPLGPTRGAEPVGFADLAWSAEPAIPAESAKPGKPGPAGKPSPMPRRPSSVQETAPTPRVQVAGRDRRSGS
nr:poly-gamma-glutamate synthase PgsB [Kibdelosporangium phytohabitans]